MPLRLFVLTALLAPAAWGAGVFGDAQWLRPPAFGDLAYLDLRASEPAALDAPTTQSTLATAFRRAFSLEEVPARAIFYVTGDDYFALYINGHFAIEGPPATYPWAHPYYTLDVTDFLGAGPNALLLANYYDGNPSGHWHSGDNRAGVIAALHLTGPDGATTAIVSDGAWQSQTLEGGTASASTALIDHAAASRMALAATDTSAWDSPIPRESDHAFVPAVGGMGTGTPSIVPSNFLSANEDLNALWHTARNGLEPRQGRWSLPDARLASRNALLHTANAAFSRSALDLFRTSFTEHGAAAVAPGRDTERAADFVFQWPRMLLEYYRLTGDRVFVLEQGRSGFARLFMWAAQYRDTSGLLATPQGMRVQVESSEAYLADYPLSARDLRGNGVLNIQYFDALNCAVRILESLDWGSPFYRAQRDRLRGAVMENLYDAERRLFRDATGVDTYSMHTNALALAVGLAPDEAVEPILMLIQEIGLSCGPEFAPYVIDACYANGAADLGYELLTSQPADYWSAPRGGGGAVALLAEHVLGCSPNGLEGNAVRLLPHVPAALAHFNCTLPLANGRATLTFDTEAGLRVTLPPDIPHSISEGLDIAVTTDPLHATGPLTTEQWDVLTRAGWNERVGADAGVWITVEDQVFRVIENGEIVYQTLCATATNGVGSMMNSEKTPLGWHKVNGKLGEDAPWGQVFRARRATHEVWTPGGDTAEDLVLTRVLLLDGLEPGLNKGGNVDSMARYIYIHGTNDEAKLGTPSSHGCIRLTNDAVIEIFRMLPDGTPVLITAPEYFGDNPAQL